MYVFLLEMVKYEGLSVEEKPKGSLIERWTQDTQRDLSILMYRIAALGKIGLFYSSLKTSE